MKHRAQAFWIERPGAGCIRTCPLPPLQADQVLIGAYYSGISRGSETLVFRGEVPPAQARAMRAPFQDGDFPGPVKYGYSSVGEVLEGPPSLQGRMVHCLYPHQDLYTVPASAAIPLPASLPPARAVLAANMETALNAAWDALPGIGDRITVIGAGVVGALIASLCSRLPGAEVELIDIDAERAGIAASLGARFRTPREATADRDLVFHASGSGDGLRLALQLAGAESRIVELSWYGTRTVELPLGEHFHVRRLTLMSSQVGTVPPQRAARWSRARRMQLALALLCDPVYDALITAECAFAELPRVLQELAAPAAKALCHRVRYDRALKSSGNP